MLLGNHATKRHLLTSSSSNIAMLFLQVGQPLVVLHSSCEAHFRPLPSQTTITTTPPLVLQLTCRKGAITTPPTRRSASQNTPTTFMSHCDIPQMIRPQNNAKRNAEAPDQGSNIEPTTSQFFFSRLHLYHGAPPKHKTFHAQLTHFKRFLDHSHPVSLNLHSPQHNLDALFVTPSTMLPPQFFSLRTWAYLRKFPSPSKSYFTLTRVSPSYRPKTRDDPRHFTLVHVPPCPALGFVLRVLFYNAKFPKQPSLALRSK